MSDTNAIRQKAFDCACDFLKVYVIRGDSEESLRTSYMAHYGDDYALCVGNYARPVGWTAVSGRPLVKLKANELAVERVGEMDCLEIFTLHEVIEEIERRWIPTVAEMRRKQRLGRG